MSASTVTRHADRLGDRDVGSGVQAGGRRPPAPSDHRPLQLGAATPQGALARLMRLTRGLRIF